MEITWYGHSCFRITERGMATVVTDPYDHTVIGYSELSLRADIVTISHNAPGHNHIDAVKGAKWHLDGPGEYEIGGVFLTAVPVGNHDQNGNGRNMVFVFDYDGITVGHLGDLTTVPSRKDVEAFGNVDILLVPVGGGNSLPAAKAAEVVNLIEPGIVVPMHYNTPEVKAKLDGLSGFLKQIGMSDQVTPEESLKVNAREIPEETRVVVLKYKH
jgi:L-ascorbate metabolism protein UlaG (beta-lactamase superfamily)